MTLDDTHAHAPAAGAKSQGGPVSGEATVSQPKVHQPYPCWDCRYLLEMRMSVPHNCPTCALADGETVLVHAMTTPPDHGRRAY